MAKLTGSYEEQFGDDTLELPFRDKTYVVRDPDAETYRWCMQLAKRIDNEGEAVVLDDDGEQELYERALGPVFDELQEDGHTGGKVLQRCGITAFFWIVGSVDMADKYWASGGDPKAVRDLVANRASRRSGSKTGASGAKASKTRSRASTSTTRTRATA